MIILQVSDRYAPRGPLDAEFFITIGIIILIIIIVIFIGKISKFFSDIKKEVEEAKIEWNKLSFKEQEEKIILNQKRKQENFIRKIKETGQVILGVLIIVLLFFSTFGVLSESYKIDEHWRVISIIFPIIIFIIGYKTKNIKLVALLFIINISNNFIILKYSINKMDREKTNKEQLIYNQKIIGQIVNLEYQSINESSKEQTTTVFDLLSLKLLMKLIHENPIIINLENDCFEAPFIIFDADSLKYSCLNDMLPDNLLAKDTNNLNTLVLLHRKKLRNSEKTDEMRWKFISHKYEIKFINIYNLDTVPYIYYINKKNLFFNRDKIDIVNNIRYYICN